MARLQIVQVPGGRYGVLIDQVEVEASIGTMAGLACEISEIGPARRDELTKAFSEVASFVVFTPATLDVVEGGF